MPFGGYLGKVSTYAGHALIFISAALNKNRERGKGCRSGFQPRYGQMRDSSALRRGWKPLLHDGRDHDHAR
jgi:hypothetical protein